MIRVQFHVCITILVLSVLEPTKLQAAAFVTPGITRTQKTTLLWDSLREPSSGTEDFEAARQMFERLHFQSGNNAGAFNGTQQTAVLPMTSNVHRLRETELRLLETLIDSDDAIDPLVELWVKEREDAGEALHYMIVAPTYDLDREEAILRDMIEDYGDGWVEPHGRLAVVLFTKGQYMEALHLCRHVLSVRPWHFEVAHLLLVIFLRMGAFGEALKTARNYVLPPPYHPKRRGKWVKRFTNEARKRLDRARQESREATIDISAEECSVDDIHCWQ